MSQRPGCGLTLAVRTRPRTHPRDTPTRHQDEVAAELACGKIFIQGTGPGGTGRPLFVVLVARHSKTASDAATVKRFVCWCLDTAAAASDPAVNPCVSGLFDFRGVGLDSLDIVALRQIFGMLQNHFPERMDRIVMYCAPRLFNALWRLLQPFLDAKTKSKVVFVGEGGAAAALPGVPPSILPRGYGGAADLVSIADAAAAMSDRAQATSGAPSPPRPASGWSAASAAGAAAAAAAAPHDDDLDVMCDADEVAALSAAAAAELAEDGKEAVEGGDDYGDCGVDGRGPVLFCT